jgi:hypothetical protein
MGRSLPYVKELRGVRISVSLFSSSETRKACPEAMPSASITQATGFVPFITLASSVIVPTF